MALPHRALFRPKLHKEFTVVRRIRMSAQSYLEPGHEMVVGEYPTWRLRIWYQRGFIGLTGDAWTEWVLEKFIDRLQREAEALVEEDETPQPDERVGILRRLLGHEDTSEEDEDEG